MTRHTRGRSTRRYRRLRREFKATCEACNEHCWLCGRPIDYGLPGGHPDSFSLDHRIPLADAPELAEDPANFAPSHLGCNTRRGRRAPHLQLGTPSELW
jgi:5-methylcytosine-specific restriction endonuclease McrA